METPSFIAAFGAGLLSFLSPCVLPLVPGYLSLMSGLSPDDVTAAENRRRVTFASLAFVLGFSLVFVAFGAAASSLGTVLVDHRQWLTRVSGVLIVVMGLVVTGLFRPMALMRERRFFPKPSQLGPYAAPVMGMAFAFGWTPCIGPILASVLALAAARETLTDGVSLLVAYSVGLGVPFVVTGIGLARLRNTLGWLRRHGRMIDLLSGGLLIVLGVLLLTDQFTRLAGYAIDFWTWTGLDTITIL